MLLEIAKVDDLAREREVLFERGQHLLGARPRAVAEQDLTDPFVYECLGRQPCRLSGAYDQNRPALERSERLYRELDRGEADRNRTGLF